jgi:hypothetical protein
VDDRLRFGLGHRPRHLVGVERVHHQRLGAETADRVGFGGAAGRAEDLVAAFDQLRDELATDHTARSRDENSHRALLLVATGPLPVYPFDGEPP